MLNCSHLAASDLHSITTIFQSSTPIYSMLVVAINLLLYKRKFLKDWIFADRRFLLFNFHSWSIICTAQKFPLYGINQEHTKDSVVNSFKYFFNRLMIYKKDGVDHEYYYTCCIHRHSSLPVKGPGLSSTSPDMISSRRMTKRDGPIRSDLNHTHPIP